MTGELHFGWVLGGRAVQDIWIVPGRGEPGEGGPPLAFHGSTIRFYDPAIDAWRSTWIEPVNGRVRRFIGRPAGDDILLLSDEDEPQLRWRFTDITPDSFRWRAEISHDGGATWELRRRDARHPADGARRFLTARRLVCLAGDDRIQACFRQCCSRLDAVVSPDASETTARGREASVLPRLPHLLAFARVRDRP